MRKTPEQRKNLELALELWRQRVRPEMVSLNCWGKCFGHYLTTWPEFKAKGIAADFEGMPFLRQSMDYFGAHQASEILFGARLFYGRGATVQECRDPEFGRLNDYQLVVRRLELEISKP